MAQHSNLAAALAAFQAELPKLVASEKGEIKGKTKDGTPYKYDYSYADLAQVTEVVSPALGRHGLSFSSRPSVTPAGFGLAYVLRHDSGERDEGFWPLPDPFSTTPQQMGSAITYARRYAFLAVTNTFPGGMDDDGKVASENAPHRPRSEQSAAERPRQERQAQPAQKKTWTDDEVRNQHAKLLGLELDKSVKLYDWMASKTLHNRVLDYPEDAGGPQSGTEVFAVRLSDLAVAKGSTLADLDRIREIADGRGLLKVPVSEEETLDEVLSGMRALRNAEALDTVNAAALRQAAEESWAEDPTQGEPQ